MALKKSVMGIIKQVSGKMVGLLFLMTLPGLFMACEDEAREVKPDDEQQNNGNSGNTTVEDAYAVVGTNQAIYYNNSIEIAAPAKGADFYGQNADYPGHSPSYTDNGDGTITDNVSGLMWQQDPGSKMTFAQALAGEKSFGLAGYDDWRLPTIKELYSLILFSGFDISGFTGNSTNDLVPFIDTNYFAFEYGDESAGERLIDSQFATSTLYTSTTMNGSETMFGVNFADGRIKGYPTGRSGGMTKTYFVLYVRGNSDYGKNNFVDNGDGTISDLSTGLMWMVDDNGEGVNWSEALDYAENLSFAGHDDWRLPDAKELQSIVDYSRSPDATQSAAIDPLFNSTPISNEAGQADYPCYWSSTTHANWSQKPGGSGAYVAFGRAMGKMNGNWIDVHGAGAQRSDPKVGDPNDWPDGHGPQGDAIRIFNYVRCVRSIN